MNKAIWQYVKPHVIAVGLFLIVSILFNLPAFKGMVLNQHDTLGWRGGAQQSFEYKEKHGHFPAWTNSMFSGMPTYQVALESKHNVTLSYLDGTFTLFLPAPARYFFLACLGLYILTQALGIRSWAGILGSFAYAFASYNAIVTAVGHNTKFTSMGYAPAMLAGIILLTQRKYILGFLVTLFFSTCLIWQNHLQIVYYTFLIAGCIGVAYAVKAIREKTLKPLFISAALAIVAVALSIASFAVILLPTSAYAKESMRGGRSELTIGANGEKKDPNKTKGGLDKSYAFYWSYGIGETFTFILPAYNGGSAGASELPEDGKAIDALQSSGIPQDAANYFYSALSAYWGPQPGTSGPVYLGAVVCALFILGLFLIRSWHLGWIIAATVIGIVLAWGSNLSGVNYFLFDHLPFYNKFRAPTTSLVIPQLTFALLASWALNELFFKEWDKKVLAKRLKYAGITTAAVVLVLIYTYMSADFKSSNDGRLREGIGSSIAQMMAQGKPAGEQALQQATGIASSIMNGLVADRKAIYLHDLWRTVVFLLLTAGLVWFATQKKVQPVILLLALAALNLIDLIPVDRRYLKDSNYVDKEEFLAPYAANRADIQIKQDTGYFRVFDQTADDPFADSRCSYHHNSIGGYLPARLALYDDIITHQLRKGNIAVYNMLNTKYFIAANPADRQPVAQLNPNASGPCWLVKNIRYVNNANEEMEALDNIGFKDTTVVDKREQPKITFTPQFDSLATIQLIKNENDKASYQFNATTNQFAVFSEVYYPHGWKAYIDGKETPIVKVDYVLRGLPVPSGKHTIEFRFEPESYILGDRISLIVGIISILLTLGGIGYLWKQYKGSVKQPA